MKIFVCCSKYFYEKLPPIIENLERKGYKIILPNSFNEPFEEENIRKKGNKTHSNWKAKQFILSNKKVKQIDALLVINFDKNGKKNYIGGATLLEMFKAWGLKKKIYILNPLPKCSFTDELTGMNPVILNGNLEIIKCPG